MDSLPKRLRYARELAGYETTTEAAHALGVPLGTYGCHENGIRGFRSDTGLRYAQFFRVSFDWLMTGRGEARPKSLDARVRALPADQQREILTFIDYIESRARPKDG